MNLNTNILARLIQCWYGSSVRRKETVAKGNLPEGEYEIDEIVTIRIKGKFTQGKGRMVSASPHLPLLAICAAAAQQCGATRESFFKKVKDISLEHMKGISKVEDDENYEKRLDEFKEKVIKQLPKVPHNGQIRYESFDMQMIDSEYAAR